VGIAIRLNVAFPESIENRKLPNEEWPALLVAPYRPVLEQLRNAFGAVIKDVVPALEEDPRAATLVSQANEPMDALQIRSSV
jgi:hypothetical protein